MVVYPKKIIATIYAILGGFITIIFAYLAIDNFSFAIRYWVVSLVITLVIAPLYSFFDNIKVSGGQITVTLEKRRGNKRVSVFFHQIAFIQEYNTDNLLNGKIFNQFSFSIHLKGRNDIKVFEIDGTKYFKKDLRKLFSYLEREHKIKYKLIVK